MLIKNAYYSAIYLLKLNYSKYLRAVLIALVFWGIFWYRVDPTTMFADSRNAVRQNDLKLLMDSLTFYQLENGDLKNLLSIPVCPQSALIGSDKKNIDLKKALTEEYLIYLPVDPKGGNAGNTGYSICIANTERIQLSAPLAEQGKTIEIIR